MLSDAREMVLEALDIRFSSNVPGNVHKKNALNNSLLLKKLHRSAIQSKDIDRFRRIILVFIIGIFKTINVKDVP